MFRKFLLTVILLSLCAACFCAPLRIVSFNLNGNVRAHRLETSEQWAEDIVGILRDAKADIILLQEVYMELDKRLDTDCFKNPRKNSALNFFTRRLSGFNGEWEYFTSASYILRKNVTVQDITYKSGNKTQNNAILYNASKLRGNDMAGALGFVDFSGKYRFDKNSAEAVEFTELETGLKVTVINVHVPFNDIESYSRDLDTLEKLYASLKLKSGVIVGGDFNTSRLLLSRRNFDNVDGTSGWYYDRGFGLTTTISVKNTEFFKFHNDYDHFVYNARIYEKKKMQRVGISSKENQFTSLKAGYNTFYTSKEFFERISDHFPVVFEFALAD